MFHYFWRIGRSGQNDESTHQWSPIVLEGSSSKCLLEHSTETFRKSGKRQGLSIFPLYNKRRVLIKKYYDHQALFRERM